MAGGAEAVEVAIESPPLKLLSQRGEQVEEEEREKETTKASQGHYLPHNVCSHTTQSPMGAFAFTF